MKRFLAVLLLGSVLALAGCSLESESYNEFLIRTQNECKDAGGVLHITKDPYMVNGKNYLCILPGTKLEIE